MLFTVTKPHKINGREVRDRITDKYISLNVILPSTAYITPPQLEEETINNPPRFISRNIKHQQYRLLQQIFSPQINKDRFLVRATDQNKTPILINQQDTLYEAALIKIWTPDTEIITDVFDAFTNTYSLEYIEVNIINQPRREVRHTRRNIETLIKEYHQKKSKHAQETESLEVRSKKEEDAINLALNLGLELT